MEVKNNNNKTLFYFENVRFSRENIESCKFGLLNACIW